MPIVKVGESDFEEFVNSNAFVVIDFTATWCGPCKLLSQALEQIHDEELPDLMIGKVDIDENRTLADAFEIEGVPTMMFFLNKQRVCFKSEKGDMDRIVGAVPKEPLLDLLKNLHDNINQGASGNDVEDAA